MTDAERTELFILVDRQVRQSVESAFLRRADRHAEAMVDELLSQPAIRAEFTALVQAAIRRALAALNGGWLMALRMGALYDALVKGQGISEEDARRASEEVAGYERQFADIRADLLLLKWMMGANTALILLVLGRVWFAG